MGRRFEYDANPLILELTEEAFNVTVTFIGGEINLGRRTIADPNGHQYKDDEVRDYLDEELEDDEEEHEEGDDDLDEGDDEEDEDFDDDFDEEDDDEEAEDESEEKPE